LDFAFEKTDRLPQVLHRITCKSAATTAPAGFFAGTSKLLFPSARARKAMGKMPLTERTAPVSANSPLRM